MKWTKDFAKNAKSLTPLKKISPRHKKTVRSTLCYPPSRNVQPILYSIGATSLSILPPFSNCPPHSSSHFIDPTPTIESICMWHLTQPPCERFKSLLPVWLIFETYFKISKTYKYLLCKKVQWKTKPRVLRSIGLWPTSSCEKNLYIAFIFRGLLLCKGCLYISRKSLPIGHRKSTKYSYLSHFLSYRFYMAVNMDCLTN